MKKMGASVKGVLSKVFGVPEHQCFTVTDSLEEKKLTPEEFAKLRQFLRVASSRVTDATNPIRLVYRGDRKSLARFSILGQRASRLGETLLRGKSRNRIGRSPLPTLTIYRLSRSREFCRS